MGKLQEYIKMALKNIKSNKGRSVLTMLGIIIGISSVIMIISIGDGIKSKINDELNTLAGGQLYLYISGDAKDDEWLNVDDMNAILDRVDHVDAVTMDLYNDTAKARAGVKQKDAIVEGGTQGLLRVYNQKVIKGRYFTEADVKAGKKVCVLRACDAKSLFGTTNAVGMSVELTCNNCTDNYTVIGIREDEQASLLSAITGNNPNVRAEIPYTAMGSSFNYWIDDFYNLYIIADSGVHSAQIAKQALNLIEARKNLRGEGVFSIQNFEDSVSSISSVLSYITIFIVFVAAISLLVGGIGVMNIMLVSVTERTREIGIRKALGARTRSIMTQFLSEAVIITAIGGIIGIIIGIIGAGVVGAVVGFKLVVNPVTVILATAFSSGIGMIFGVYPAKKAAKLSPIDALRHE